ncbi:hypothetical protein ACLI4U_15525 [Natrialbaceae archaeon A-CW2]|uniref:hypothetical protein n=1 Tax=Natronosalvus amylolyticus TaxID=2961994 RepID=UPI0020C9DBA1|nr:hypothetical protein [Natronosalvus amylolyticus]
MASAIETLDLENDLVQWFATEAVKVGMGSPLRDSILEAVEETTGETLETDPRTPETDPDRAEEPLEEADTDDSVAEEEKDRLTMLLQGGTVFLVLFVVLYVVLRRLTRSESTT